MSPFICITEGILLATLISLLMVQSVYGVSDECQTQDDINELCQLCAKQTKSRIVYPMCCENTEEARVWCKKYTDYGIQERHTL